MAFDFSANFQYTGIVQTWEKPAGLTSVYFITRGAGGGGSITNGGGGAYIYSNFTTLNPDVSYNVNIYVGSGGNPAPSGAGGVSLGGSPLDASGNCISYGGAGTTLSGLSSAGGGGMTNIYYNDPLGFQVIKIIAGGGGGAGNNSAAKGGNSGTPGGYGNNSIGDMGSGVGGGEGGNSSLIGDGGLGGIFGGVNGYNYQDNSGTSLYIGGGGGGGGTFAGGGGGGGFGGGAGGKQGGGGGGGSFSNANSKFFISGGGGAGGGAGSNSGFNGSVTILYNNQPPIIPKPIVNMFMLDAQHTSKSIYNAPIRIPLTVKTLNTAQLKNPYDAIIGFDEEIYIVSGDGVLYALNHDFTLKWTYQAPAGYKFIGTPAMGLYNTLYISSTATPPNLPAFYAIVDNGTIAGGGIKWQFSPLDGNPSTSPVLDLSNNIYFGTDKGTIYKLSDGSSAGLLNWQYPVSSPTNLSITTTPTFDISYNKLCYATNNLINSTSTLTVLDISSAGLNPATLHFQYPPITNAFYNTPSIDKQGFVYASTTDTSTSTSSVYAYDISSNANKWLTNPLVITDASLSAIAIGNDNHIYFTSKNALNMVDSSNGLLEWSYPIDNSGASVPNNSIPMLDASNNIYFGARNAYLYSVNGLQRTYNWRAAVGVGSSIQSTPVLGIDNNIYLGANDGKIYDFSGNSPPVQTNAPIVPMYMLDVKHTGLSAYSGLATAIMPTFAWAEPFPFASGNLFVSPSIAIGYDGTLYFGSNDGLIYALDPILEVVHAPYPLQLPLLNPNNGYMTSPKSIYTTPAIAPDGTLYIGSNEGYLFALEPIYGTIKWSYNAGYPLQSSPIIDASSGSIYFGAGYSVFAIGDAGFSAYPKWLAPFQTQGQVNSSPVLGSNGYLYFGSSDGNVYSIDSFTGLLIWTYSPSPSPPPIRPIYTSAAIDVSGNVIIGNGSYMNGILYCIDGTTGLDVWSVGGISFDPSGGPIYNTVAIKDDTIYLSTIAYVFAINRTDGTVKGKYFGESFYYTSPVIDASGTLFVGCINAKPDVPNGTPLQYGILLSLTDNGASFTENWRFKITEGEARPAPPVLDNNKTIYISTTDNNIYAIKSIML